MKKETVNSLFEKTEIKDNDTFTRDELLEFAYMVNHTSELLSDMYNLSEKNLIRKENKKLKYIIYGLVAIVVGLLVITLI